MKFPPKAVPAPSLTLLSHPEQDRKYRHFEHGGSLPFDAGTRQFSPLNAWWLADATLLAYWPEAEGRRRFHDDGGFDDSRFIDRDGTQCYVAWTKSLVVVAFRGTQPSDRMDILRDVNIVLKPWVHGGEEVHGGFKDALDVVWDDLAGALEALPGRSVWFTGHSLGAALATLAGDRFGDAAGIYTFGSPLVGIEAFAAGFNLRHTGRSFRYVNNHDVVTHVPPGLMHVGAEKHIAADGTIPAVAPAHTLTAIVAAAADLFQKVGANVQLGADLVPVFLVDHTPRRYATFVWNELARTL